MGSTASINYAASKKYKPSEPIEVKFDKVVKYDDGDEKPFKDGFQVAAATKKQPLSLLASAIRMLERKPRELPPPNGHLPNNYAKQVRPRSAYVVMKKPTVSQSSSTLNSSHQSGSRQLNGMTPKMSQTKQLKTKQNLYMNLIYPTTVPDTRTKLRMTVPSRIQTPMDYHIPVRQHKANTLPRCSAADGKRIRVNRKLYMDMIRPVMTSPQYLKLGASRSTLPTPITHRTASRQSQVQQTRLTPRAPPNGGQILKQRNANLGSSHPKQQNVATRREVYRPRREEYLNVSKPLTPQVRSIHSGSLGNNSSLNRDIHLPRITRKTKDDVSLNSSLNSRSEIPRGHPENITPLYFRKSLAYSPQYERKELLSNPLSSMNT